MTPRNRRALTIGDGDLSWEVPVSLVEPRPLTDGRSAPVVRDPEAESIVRSLAAKTPAPRAVIERVVAEELARFRGARVQNFVAILVERAAARRLPEPSRTDTEPTAPRADAPREPAVRLAWRVRVVRPGRTDRGS